MKRGNEKGQMAIFIALIFQVLFVFFAMAINVGMVVHDKINLQNAVDLAAYYGAQKQAEVLNQIAHINYQIRQSFKLFVWRYRVLGSIGLDVHPLNPRGGFGGGGEAAANFPPSFCVSHDLWQEYFALDPNSSICRTPNINLPNIPRLEGGAGIVPGFNALENFVDATRTQFSRQCNEAGIVNWLFAARMLAHFRIDVLVRKRMINALSDAISAPAANMQDLRGESVQQGVLNTLRNNLTESNAEGFQDAQFQFFNSMSQTPCGDFVNDQYRWLPEIHINPIVRYTDLDGTNVDAGCVGTGQPNSVGDQGLPAGQAQFPGRIDPVLAQHWAGEPNGPLRSTLGFEKDPWCMTYTGVSATTVVSKPFSPMGQTLQLSATSFAKPFGGRIGPWYSNRWPSGTPFSNGDRTDPLVPSRSAEQGGQVADLNADLINYSRFPGDTLGMNSLAALSAMTPRASGVLAPGTPAFAWADYNHLGGLARMENSGDSLARPVGSGAPQRELELAATAPDLFDATYFSVEPQSFELYFSDVATNGGALLDPNTRVFEFGSSKDGGAPNSPNNFNLIGQVQNANGVYAGGPGAGYTINDWHHLLTSWVQNEATDFGFPAQADRFAGCQVDGNPNFPTTGNCIAGGRTGYSVKLISREYIQSNHAIGGDGEGAGQILNPPIF